jgi:5-methylthioadenosine/S-adenosylhomocysteine deaminase
MIEAVPDLLIENGSFLMPGGWQAGGYMAVSGGLIAGMAVGAAPDELRRAAKQVISAEGKAVLPGLTNAHTHLSQTFMRGLAGGRPLLRWLKELIWPLQAAMSLEELKLAAMLGLAENLRYGSTAVVDHQKVTGSIEHSLAVCDAAEAVGLRLTLARAWVDKGAAPEEPKIILEELRALFERYAGNPWISVLSGPLTPWRATAETLQATHTLARCCGAGTHMHVSETQDEVNLTLKETGLRPVTWLDSLGVLDESFQLVHGVWLDPDEIDLVAKRKATVVHCPVSNAVLGSGTAPVRELRAAGVPIRLGTDGPASNDAQDPFDTMKAALYFARLRALDPTALGPASTVRMATAGKALAPGATADVILIDLRTVSAAGVADVDSALAMCCHGSDVDTVIVGGKILMQGKKILVFDEEALLKECESAAARLRKRAGI